MHSYCTWLPPFAMIGLRESLLDTCRCSWPPPASPFSLLITVALIKDMVHESSPNLGHLEGWGALLALQLRGWAPSSWPRPPSTPGAQVSPHHHLIHFLLILVPQGEVLFLHFCTTFEEPHNDLGFICVTGHLTIQFNRIFPSCYIGRRALQIF